MTTTQYEKTIHKLYNETYKPRESQILATYHRDGNDAAYIQALADCDAEYRAECKKIFNANNMSAKYDMSDEHA